MPTTELETEMLRLLDENAEFLALVRSKILTDELIKLPEEFAKFVAATNRRFDAIESQMDVMNRRLDRLESDVSTLKSDVATLKNDVGELKGVSLENKLYNRAISLIATYFGLYDSERMRVAERDDNSAEFNATIYEALNSGALTTEEYGRIIDTDMVARGRKPGAAHPVYVAIEASYSLSRADIDKVCRTAELIGSLFPEAEASAALYYVTPNAEIEAEAKSREVVLMRIPNLA